MEKKSLKFFDTTSAAILAANGYFWLIIYLWAFISSLFSTGFDIQVVKSTILLIGMVTFPIGGLFISIPLIIACICELLFAKKVTDIMQKPKSDILKIGIAIGSLISLAM